MGRRAGWRTTVPTGTSYRCMVRGRAHRNHRIAAFVPVPDGPASLGLPALFNDDALVNQNGALVGPDGNPESPHSGSPSRKTLGQAGG